MIKPTLTQVRTTVATMVLAASTLVGIAVHEGYKDEAYIPVPGDVPTIDFGRTKGVKMGDKSNPVRGLQLLLDEVDSVYAQGVRRCITAPMYQYEFAASVSLAYNIGVKAFCGSTVAKRFNAEDYAGACAAFDMWNRQGGRILPGLVKRRAEERAICEGRA
jgi:lysozyme